MPYLRSPSIHQPTTSEVSGGTRGSIMRSRRVDVALQCAQHELLQSPDSSSRTPRRSAPADPASGPGLREPTACHCRDLATTRETRNCDCDQPTPRADRRQRRLDRLSATTPVRLPRTRRWAPRTEVLAILSIDWVRGRSLRGTAATWSRERRYYIRAYAFIELILSHRPCLTIFNSPTRPVPELLTTSFSAPLHRRRGLLSAVPS